MHPIAPLAPLLEHAPAPNGKRPALVENQGPTPPIPPSGMSEVAWLVFPLVLLGSAVLALVILWASGATASIRFSDASAAITFTTGAALVIERLIETGWTIYATTKAGSYWPMSGVSTYVTQLVNNLDTAFDPFLAEANKTLATAAGTTETIKTAVTGLKQDITRFKGEIAELRKLGQPSNQQSLLLSAATAQRIHYLKVKYSATLDTVGYAATLASSAVDGLQNFAATFKDNPGRRIISICIGGTIGIIVTGSLQLDLFEALATGSQPPAAGFTAAFHIVLTGLVIGLGAGPTHEVIRLIQESKERRKGANASQPDQ